MRARTPPVPVLIGVTLLALSAASGLGDAFAGEDAVAALIASLDTAGRTQRLAVIDKLAAVKDRRAAAALARQLDRKVEDAEEREEFWLHLLQALRAHAYQGHLDKHVLVRLDKLGKTEATVTYRDPSVGRGRVPLPKYGFQSEAQHAASAVRMHLAQVELRAQLARLSDDEKVAHLVATAWKLQKPDDGPLQHAARKELRKRGRQGIAPSQAAAAGASSENQQALVAYFAELYETTKDEACISGLLLLARAREVAVWQDALLKLGQTRAESAAEPLMKLIKENAEPPLRLALAVEVLGQVGTKKHIPFLVSRLTHKERDVYGAAVSALRPFGKEAVAALKDALRSTDRATRTQAGRALIGMRGPERTKALKEFVRQHPDEDPVLLRKIQTVLEWEEKEEN
jgi:hypothetical protein